MPTLAQIAQQAPYEAMQPQATTERQALDAAIDRANYVLCGITQVVRLDAAQPSRGFVCDDYGTLVEVPS